LKGDIVEYSGDTVVSVPPVSARFIFIALESLFTAVPNTGSV